MKTLLFYSVSILSLVSCADVNDDLRSSQKSQNILSGTNKKMRLWSSTYPRLKRNLYVTGPVMDQVFAYFNSTYAEPGVKRPLNWFKKTYPFLSHVRFGNLYGHCDSPVWLSRLNPEEVINEDLSETGDKPRTYGQCLKVR